MTRAVVIANRRHYGELNRIELHWKDDVAEKLLERLESIDFERANLILMRAAKHEGQKAHTLVKRRLKERAGLGKYGFATDLVKSRVQKFGKPGYIIYADGAETNVNLFGMRVAKHWISAKPRGTFQKYRRAFLWHGKVFHRLGEERYPIKEIYGPNIARELAKPDVVAVWERGLNGLNKRIGYELHRELFRVLK